jgi:hypothetical protein
MVKIRAVWRLADPYGACAGGYHEFPTCGYTHPCGARQSLRPHFQGDTVLSGDAAQPLEFTFTPTHGSWLNLIESFFGKMAKTLLRGIRVASAGELKARIELYLKEINETPVVFRWKYKLEILSVL